MGKVEQAAIIAADVTREGLVVHFSNGTIGLFTPEFLYRTRDQEGNTSIMERGEIVEGSQIAEALNEE